MSSQNETSSLDLLEIVRGVSVLDFDSKKYYFKHPTVLDTLESEQEYEDHIKRSVDSGIKREKELIDKAIKIGGWSVAKEEKIKSLKWMIKKSYSSLAKIKDLKQREVFDNQIKSQEVELKEIESDRNRIIQYSAEHLASVKKTKFMVDRSLFTDSELKNNPEENIGLISVFFSKFSHLNKKETLLNASFHGGFFDLYVTQSKNPLSLLNKDFTNITLFQKGILILSSSLLNKMRGVNIPEEISQDPVKILEYEEKNDQDKKVSHGVDDLRNKMKARGGKLKAEDFLS